MCVLPTCCQSAWDQLLLIQAKIPKGPTRFTEAYLLFMRFLAQAQILPFDGTGPPKHTQRFVATAAQNVISKIFQ